MFVKLITDYLFTFTYQYFLRFVLYFYFLFYYMLFLYVVGFNSFELTVFSIAVEFSTPIVLSIYKRLLICIFYPYVVWHFY